MATVLVPSGSILLSNNLTSLKVPQGINHSDADVNETVARTLNPSKLVTYLPAGLDYTTPQLTANTNNYISLPTVVKSIKDFVLAGTGGGTLAYIFEGEDNTTFSVNMSTSMLTSTNNVIIAFEAFKNNIRAEGLSGKIKVSTGSDVGAISITGEITLNYGDYIELHITPSLATTITFIETSINICERN